MAIYWCTDVIPVAITALLPVVLFPLLHILDSKQVSRSRGTWWLPGSPIYPFLLHTPLWVS
jgi:di/tricarboxylate transporter